MTEHSELIAGEGERHLVYGTTRSGKSCHIDWEMRGIQQYRPECMQLLIDTKPRFRAETERSRVNPKGRKNAAWRYGAWAKGPVVPNSVLIDIWDEHPFRGIWTRPGEIAVMQSGDANEWRQMLKIMMAFAKAHVKDRERHIIADEVLDFYGRTTWSIDQKNDAFYLASRSGGERKIGITLGSQRVYGLPILVRNMASRITLYHLDEEKDTRYLAQNGIPDAKSPKGGYVFNQWIKEPGGAFSKPYTAKLEYPQSYLEQLSAA